MGQQFAAEQRRVDEMARVAVSHALRVVRDEIERLGDLAALLQQLFNSNASAAEYIRVTISEAEEQ